jgi:hypothetical protein
MTARRTFMQLMPRHLQWVEKLSIRPIGNGKPGRPGYDRNAMLSFYTEKYDQYFGCLRGSKAKGVPSDELRKFLMISQLLDIVDGQRAGYLNSQLGTQARM